MSFFSKEKIERGENTNGTTMVNYNNQDVYKENAGVDLDTLKKVEKFRSEYLEQATNLASEEAKSIMEKDKDVNKVIATFPYTASAKGSLEVVVDRSKTFPGVNGSDPVTKSKITVIVNDPVNKVSKSKIRALESTLTEALISGKK